MSEELLDDVELDMDETPTVTDVIELDRPHITSPEWNDWVMSMFEDDEKFDGYPIAAGLRRVAELVIGEIIESMPVSSWTTPPIEGINGSATQWQITFQDRQGNIRRFGDVGDANAMNTEDEYLRFALATSATRAEARTLRKALRLRKVSAEELTNLDVKEVKKARTSAKYEKTSSGEHNSTTSSKEMSDKQEGYINALGVKLDLNVKKILESIGLNPEVKLDKSGASMLLEKMSAFRNDPGTVPEEFVGFVDWSV
jgi:hypothetical protein